MADQNLKKWDAIKFASSVVNYPLPDLGAQNEYNREEWVNKRKDQERLRADEEKEAERQKEVTQNIKDSLFDRLKPYCSDQWGANLFHASPLMGGSPEQDACAMIQALFEPDEIIWLGEPRDSGQERHRKHFMTTSDWVAYDETPHSRVCLSSFKMGSFSRTKENIQETRFLCIESDELIGKKPETAEEKEQNKMLNAGLIK